MNESVTVKAVKVVFWLKKCIFLQLKRKVVFAEQHSASVGHNHQTREASD